VGARVRLELFCPVRGLGSLPGNAIYSVKASKKATTDTDLERIAHLTGLRELDASKARPVSDSGLWHLLALRELRLLDLYQSGVTDAGLVHLAGLEHMERLHLGMTGVRGRGLIHLRRLQRLRWLSLEDTEVDDAALPHLLALGSLRTLVLFGTRVGEGAIEALRSVKPGLELVTGSGAGSRSMEPVLPRLSPAEPTAAS
jgi:hypothetical protein